MAYPPSQSINVRSSGVNLSTLGTVYPLVVGYTSGGTPDSLSLYTNSNDLKDEQGHGAAVELSLSSINRAGGVLLLNTTATTAGTVSSVTPTRVGTSVGTVAVAGTAYYPHIAIIEITETTVALGSGKFRYTLDNGYTYSGDITIPSGGTYLIPGTNVTLTFALQSGTPDFEDGDIFSFTCVPAEYTTTNIGDAWEALMEQIGNNRFRRAFFAGESASASAGASMAAAVATAMATADSNAYFARAMKSVGTDTAANARSAYVAAFADDRVASTFGVCEYSVRDSFVGWGRGRVPILWPVAERAMANSLSENLGRKASGPLRGVLKIRAEDGTWGHDELTNQAFVEADRLITLRSFRGEAGYYVTNGYLRSADASDFKYWDWGTTIDAICEIVQREQDKKLLSSVRVLQDGSGRIDPRDAKAIEDTVRQALYSAIQSAANIEPGIRGHVSALQYQVDLTVDMLTTKELVSSFGAVPLVPIEGIATEGGFVRSVV